MLTVAHLRARLRTAAWDLRAWRARTDGATFGDLLPSSLDRSITDAVSLGFEGATYVVAPVHRGAIIVSAGVGAEVTFELQAIEQFGAVVHALDPTAESAAFVADAGLPGGFEFHPLALGGSDGPIELGTLKPASRRYRAVSALTAGDRGETLVAEAVRLSTLAERLGVESVDVLKLDIEGGEYPVLDDVLEHGPLPRQLILEFHPHILNLADAGSFSGSHGWEVTGVMIDRIRQRGYETFHISERGTEFSFIRDDPREARD